MTRDDIIQAVQKHCADILTEGREWDETDAVMVAALLKQDDDPVGLFRKLDEQTGDWRIGYKTKDGREWFPILRQMRNRRHGGLLDHLVAPRP